MHTHAKKNAQRKDAYMTPELSALFGKHMLANLIMALLASLIRWQLMEEATRRWYDVFVFLLYAVFVMQLTVWAVAPLDFVDETKLAITAGSALIANEVIRGMLKIAVKIFPVLERRVESIIERGRL
jgi:hypothetical protein